MGKSLNISIVGFGNIGKFISTLLLAYETHQFNINIMDIDPFVHGAIVDLTHASEFHPQHRIFHNNQELLENSDFVFHCAGASVPKGKSRLHVAQKSIQITEAIFNNLNFYRTPFIIVVANPVDVITAITQKITNLPKTHVIGTGTFLDTIRMNSILKNEDPNSISVDAILLGEHGSTVFLSKCLSTFNGKPFSQIFNDSEISALIQKVKNSAEEIKNTQKATIYGVSFCAFKLFQSLITGEEMNAPVSTYIMEELATAIGAKEIFLSLPANISTKGATPSKAYSPNEEEMIYLKESVKAIQTCIPRKYL